MQSACHLYGSETTRGVTPDAIEAQIAKFKYEQDPIAQIFGKED